MSSGSPITYDARLVEETVLLAERGLSTGERTRFRSERDRIYEAEDSDEREARFDELHSRFFIQLGLDRPLHASLSAHPDILRRVAGCHVRRAVAQRDEGADLRDDLSPATPPDRRAPVLVLRLRPQSLLVPDRLIRFLRRELQHVADMLDPAFGYQRELAAEEADPAVVSLLRERYRVVWDTTVEGRLARRQGPDPPALLARRAEFLRAFPALGGDAEAVFEVWFNAPRPTHPAILRFVRASRPAALPAPIPSWHSCGVP